MKKVKIALVAVALVLGIGGAVAATHDDPPCYAQQQLKKIADPANPGQFLYVPAGTIGTNFICETSSAECTYVLDPVTQQPVVCRVGTFVFISNP